MIVAVIPAKGDSNRLADKNLLEINNLSLIEHAIRYARGSDRVDSVYVSTDSDAIANLASELGVGAIMRGEKLGGEAPLMDVYRHALGSIADREITHLVGIQPDNPDRTVNLDRAIEYAREKNIDYLFTVDREGNRNGSLTILSLNALTSEPSIYASSIRDDCTNIHSRRDFLMASRNLSGSSGAISLGSRKVGPDEPVFVVAEAACNHMCDMDLARKMIDRAAEAGADGIKFQTYKAERLVTPKADAFWGEEKISQMEYYRRLDRFGKEEYAELFGRARDRGILAFSSPFDARSADMLAELDMPVFKIASCDITNLDLVGHIARFGKPVILSTGASSPEEIEGAIEAVFDAGNYQLILLACTLSYPTRNSDANLMRIRTLRERYPNMVVGLSDHTEPDRQMIIPSIAVALGARLIEKHYTLDRSMTGSGHFFAVDPGDLEKMVKNIRLTETLFGDGLLGVAASEERARQSARRSIVAERTIRKGEIITNDMLGIKRPSGGLEGNRLNEVVGKRARIEIEQDKIIELDELEPIE